MTSARPSKERGTAEILGYDTAVLEAIPRQLRRDLDSLSQAWLVSCALLGFPMGLALWLVEHSLFLAFLTSFATSALALNLLRLLTAGSGTAPDLVLVRGYRPSPTPMVMLFGLAVILSQPAQLLHANDDVRNQVAEHRDKLLRSHRAALTEFGQSGVDSFEKEIEACEFVVLRLSLLWDFPQKALLWTLVYVGLTMLPAALARTSYLKAVRAYERVRYLKTRDEIEALEDETRQAVASALKSYPTYRPTWPFPPEAPLALPPQAPGQSGELPS